MDISTKFSLGDTVYWMEDNRIKEGKIYYIEVKFLSGKYRMGEIWNNKRRDEYEVKDSRLTTYHLDVSQLFGSVEELCEFLKDGIVEC